MFAYRAVLTIYMIIFLVIDIVYFRLHAKPVNRMYWAPWKWFIYVNHWQAVLAVCYHVIALVTDVYILIIKPNLERRKRQEQEDRTSPVGSMEKSLATSSSISEHDSIESGHGLSWYIKVRWFLLNVTFANLFLSVFYWILFTHRFTFTDVHRQGVALLLNFFEIFMVSHPIYLQHCWHTHVAGCIYDAFAVTYLVAGGVDENGKAQLSPAIDIEKNLPTTVIFQLTMFVAAVPAAQGFAVLLAQIRERLRRKYFPADISKESTTVSSSENRSRYSCDFQERIEKGGSQILTDQSDDNQKSKPSREGKKRLASESRLSRGYQHRKKKRIHPTNSIASEGVVPLNSIAKPSEGQKKNTIQEGTC